MSVQSRIFILLIFISVLLPTMVHAETPLTAAFIRDHQLWIKKRDQEIKITKNRYVYSQKWSYNGRFIGFIDGDEKGEKHDLFIYDTKEKETYQPYVRVETSDFKWSPIKNQLAYNDRGLLNVTKTEHGRPQGFENVSLGVDGFEWFPNGKEFIASSQSCLRPTGWGPIPLYRIPVDANLKSGKMNHFYTIPTNGSDLFAIGANYFKWSSDGKWLSFLAIPTASWSNDSNTLCVISSMGKHFQVIGKMLWFKDWMKWAPCANKIAYISGEGRFFVDNKNTTVADMPASTHQKKYTPKGFVDLDLDWFSPDKVIVARAKENKEWKEGPVPTMYTSLYAINLRTGEQTPITFPKQEELDVNPQKVGTYLTWLRRKENPFKGDVWVKDGLSGKERLWLKDVDESPSFFTPK
jgi:hypothetical protein